MKVLRLAIKKFSQKFKKGEYNNISVFNSQAEISYMQLPKTLRN